MIDVIDLDPGTTPKAKVWMGSRSNKLVDGCVNITGWVNADNPCHLCSECLAQVDLISTPNKRFFPSSQGMMICALPKHDLESSAEGVVIVRMPHSALRLTIRALVCAGYADFTTC